MNEIEIKLLNSTEVREILNANAGMKPADFALKNSKMPNVALLSTQLGLLQKAADKLPSWSAAGCLFTRQSLEQSTSEAVAGVKPFGRGEWAIDLCAGLGVDAVQMSKTYKKVIAVEADADLCALAKFNFSQLGITNIEVVNSTAEDFIASAEKDESGFPGSPSTFIYLDPSRRDSEGGRKYHPAHCVPDYFALEKLLHKHSSGILLKTSPIFDFREGIKTIGNVKEVTAISVSNECKEILYEIIPAFNGIPELTGIAVLSGKSFSVSMPFSPENSTTLDLESPVEYSIENPPKFILEPDTVFYVLGLEQALFQKLYPECMARPFSKNGYFFSDSEIINFAGRAYKVVEMIPFKPETIRAALNEKGIEKVNLGRKNFQIPFAQIRKDFGISEGGIHHLLFTNDNDGQKIALLCERI